MGQRHQIFINTVNPYHNTNDKVEKEKLKVMFGTKKTTVFAFHNQWLYGRSALLSALNVLEFNEGESKNYNNPLCKDGMRNTMHRGFKNTSSMIEAILNLCREENEFRSKGWLGSWLLNESEPKMREFFTHGDNNDGITIIDTIQNKYCFMNIYDYENEEISNSISDLPYLTPLSGKDYVEAYCPSLSKTAKNSYYGKEALSESKEKFKEHLSEAKKINNSLVKRLSKFELLSEKELKNIFKKQYSELLVESLVKEAK